VSYSILVEKELEKLVHYGAILKCPRSFGIPKCVSPIGCVPKKCLGKRLIVDMRSVNQHIHCPTFQYDDINTVYDLIQPDDELVTLNLEKEFYHIPIHPDFWTYLGMCWKGQYYVWKVLPFGLNVSPYYFFKSVRVVVTYLRAQDFKCSVFVHDFILSCDENNIIANLNYFLT
jgi:hypothetical protein